MRPVFLCLLVLSLALSVQAQDKNKRKNVIKTRPLNVALTAISPVNPINFNLTYERVLAPKLTGLISLEYSPPSELGIFDYLPFDSAGLTPPKVGGFGIKPAIRIYPGLKKTPRGFYLAIDVIYSRYTSSLGANMTFPYNLDVPGYGTYTYDYNRDFTLTGTLSNIGGGIGIGRQWLIKDRLSIDILFFGIAATYTTLSLKLEGELLSESEIEQQVTTATGQPFDMAPEDVPTWTTITQEFKGDVAEGISEIPYFGDRFTLESESDGVRVALSSIAPRMKLFNFSIGIAF